MKICAERKLKEFRIKTLVTIADEPKYLEKFTKYCAKDTVLTAQEKQEQARQAAEKAAKDKVTAPPKPAVVAAPPPPAPKTTTAAPTPATTSAAATSQPVFGGCGMPALQNTPGHHRACKPIWGRCGEITSIKPLSSGQFNLCEQTDQLQKKY